MVLQLKIQPTSDCLKETVNTLVRLRILHCRILACLVDISLHLQ